MTIKVDLLDKPGRRMGFDFVMLFLALIVMLAIVGFVIYGQTLDKKIAQIKKDIAVVDEEIRKQEDRIPKIKETEEINKDLKKQIQSIKEAVYDPIRYANLLDELALIMPKNIFIRNLSIDPTRRQITFNGLSVEVGGAQPLDSISKFMTNLQKSRYFKTATLSNTSRTKYAERTAYGFQIRAEYDPEAAVKE